MTVDVWNKCDGKSNTKKIAEIAWRIVESQENTSTRKLVDSLEEQEILDNLIEQSKPPILKNQSNLHYLLYTPFRYPPLKNGSRFGNKREPSIWYGSLSSETAIAEKAFYQLSFIRASTGNFEVISIPFTLFSVGVKTSKGIKLNEKPFQSYTHLISSPVRYEESQLLGTNMRNENIDAFTFHSARDLEQGINIGLFNSNAFINKNPNTPFQTWQCFVTKNLAEFIKTDPTKKISLTFPIDNFLIEGNLPLPAI